MTRILMISPWASRAGGGLQSSVRDLALCLRSNGVGVTAISCHDSYTAADVVAWDGVQIRLSKYFGPESLRFSPGLLGDVMNADADIIQLHGIWMFPSAAVSLKSYFSNIPFIISPHGMLDPWILSRGVFKKAIAKLFYENRNWRAASAFRALNKSEADSIHRAIPHAKNIFTIPNGVGVVPVHELHEMDRERERVGRRIFTFLGRIHEKKAVLELVEAWKVISDRKKRDDIELRIAGWGDSEYVSLIQSASAGCSSISFVGPVFGDAKHRLLSQSTDFVLPSHSEGLPVAVLEACSYGLLPLISHQCNLPDLFEKNIALLAEPNIEAIVNSIESALALDCNEVKERRFSGYSHIARNYSWEVVAAQFEEMHRSLGV